MKNIYLLVAALLSLAVVPPAFAAVYRWEDDKGVVNFTEDLGKVPLKYRSRVGIVGDDQATEPAVVIRDLKEEKREPSGGAGPGKDPLKTDGAGKKATYGGKDEGYWKEEFRRVKYELQIVREQVEAVNARMSKSDQMSRSEYKSLENTRKLLEEQELGARKRLDALNAEAGKAGVPPDIR